MQKPISKKYPSALHLETVSLVVGMSLAWFYQFPAPLFYALPFIVAPTLLKPIINHTYLFIPFGIMGYEYQTNAKKFFDVQPFNFVMLMGLIAAKKLLLPALFLAIKEQMSKWFSSSKANVEAEKSSKKESAKPENNLASTSKLASKNNDDIISASITIDPNNQRPTPLVYKGDEQTDMDKAPPKTIAPNAPVDELAKALTDGAVLPEDELGDMNHVLLTKPRYMPYNSEQKNQNNIALQEQEQQQEKVVFTATRPSQ